MILGTFQEWKFFQTFIPFEYIHAWTWALIIISLIKIYQKKKKEKKWPLAHEHILYGLALDHIFLWNYLGSVWLKLTEIVAYKIK